VNTADPQGTTLLMIAAHGNNIDLARFLLDNRANPQRRNRYGDTALMIAALQGHAAIVRLMLERKIDPNQEGWNALHYAAFENRAEIAALMLAAKRGHLETVRMLVGANADAAVRDADEGTAQDMAKQAGHTDIARFLERSTK
jgi:ankyrin repeat protein